MKKISSVLLILCIYLTGCGVQPSENNPSDPVNTPQVILETTDNETKVISEAPEEYITEASAVSKASESESDSKKIQVPSASSMCEGKNYSEVVESFRAAGFTNVTASSYESDQSNENFIEGCVMLVSIEDDLVFDGNAKYEPDAEVNIYYASSPKETQAVTTAGSSAADTSYHSDKSNDRNSVTVPDETETEGELVWVPVNGGTKYHSREGCSNMKDPIQVSLDTAIENGYTPCGRCH